MGVHGDSNYTMAAWLRPTGHSNSGDRMVFGQPSGNFLHNGTRGGAYHQGHYGNDIGGGDVDAININQWRHVTWLYKDGVEQILVNGSTVAGPAARGALNNTTNILVGAVLPGNRYYQGELDDVVIYEEAITGWQIYSLVNGGDPANLPTDALPAVTPGMHWHMTVIRDGANSLGAAITDLETWWSNGGATNVTQEYTEVVYHEDPGQGGGTKRRGPRDPFPGDPAGAENNFAIGARGVLDIVEEGDYTFMVLGDDGSRFRLIGSDSWTASGIGSTIGTDDGFQVTGCCQDGLGQVHLAPGKYPTELIWNEKGGGAYVEVWAARGNYSAYSAEAFFLLGEAGLDALNMVHIPEPGTLLVWSLLGALGLAGWRRRRA
jgi:hypothetical protein